MVTETETATGDRVVSDDPGQVRESLGGVCEEMEEGLGGLLDERGKGDNQAMSKGAVV